MAKGKSNPKLAKNIQSALRKSGLPDTSKVVITSAKPPRGKRGR